MSHIEQIGDFFDPESGFGNRGEASSGDFARIIGHTCFTVILKLKNVTMPKRQSSMILKNFRNFLATRLFLVNTEQKFTSINY